MSRPASPLQRWRVPKEQQLVKKAASKRAGSDGANEEPAEEPTSPGLLAASRSPSEHEGLGSEMPLLTNAEEEKGCEGNAGAASHAGSDGGAEAEGEYAQEEGEGAETSPMPDFDDGVPVSSIVCPRSPDTVTDPLHINEGFFITHGKFTYGINSDDILLKGTAMELPDGLTLGNVRVSRSYEQWAPFVKPINLFVVEHEGVSYMYVVMCVAGSDSKKKAVDSRRLRHVPSAVAIKIVQELKKKADNWPDWKVEKYKPVLHYEETENQQIEPRSAKWQVYKKIKNVPSAEESHEPVPRKKKESRGGRARAPDSDEMLDVGDDDEAPTVVMRGANKVKRFKIGVGERAHLVQLGRYVYVFVEDAPVDDVDDN